ncbi:MAG: sigma-70 family RNA polymerase sigma factor [Planctomycetaceae bacterium]|nr:sigma-70 family RNA polymerase sigma factor [Planctomycetales bacterium]MCB9922906.1 sigma-70 family RNA polymerase sigma factor [Planctomycetaceae bacterium]
MSDENSEFRKVVERVCAGSDEAAWELIDTYGPHIQRVVRRKLNQKMRSKFDSLDFVQMVWASFFTERKKLAQFTEPTELIKYLATIAQRKLIQESRRRLQGQKHNVSRERVLIANSEDESAYVRKSNTPSQIVMAKDRLEAMMRERSDRDRQVVELRMQGLTFVEIGEALGIHERTAREVIEKLALVETA